MSILIGTNIRRDGSDPIPLILASGSMAARFVPMAEHDLRGFLADLREIGVEPVAVLARESFGLGPRLDWGRISDALDQYRLRYGGLVRYWQVGNEWDMESESSWTLDLDDLVRIGSMARAAFGPEAYLIVGGAGDGSADDEEDERLSGVNLSWANAIAIHTYGQRVPGWVNDDGLPVLPLAPYDFIPSTVRDLIDGYKAQAPDLDLWITEMGFRWDELGEVAAAKYCEAFLTYLIERCPEVTGCLQFALTDAQVMGFGLYTSEGHAHQTAAYFARAAARARELAEDDPPPPPPVVLTAEQAEELAWGDLFLAATGERMRGIVFAPQLGIVKFWREHHDELGSAVGPERAASDGAVVFQAFATGIVKWDPASGASKVA